MVTSNAFKTSKRKVLTPQQRAKLFLEKKGVCFSCKRRLGPKDKWIAEHLLALENGGTNDWANLDVCCSDCFAKKNAKDDAIAAKTRSVATKHFLHSSLTKKKNSKPIAGSKASGWKRKMDGTTVRRDEE